MTPPKKTRLRVLALGALLLPVLPSANALLNIDGARNQLFVFGNAMLSYNSNVFSNSLAESDYSLNTTLGVELKRRAGIIAVNAVGKISYQRFDKFSDQNSYNPNFYISFNKSTGRTTGSVTISAFRESRSDSVVNSRTTSWNFPVELSLKYPINEKFYLTSSTNYLRRRYSNNPSLANYTDYAESLDLFYVYTSKLDLIGGYRIRISQTSFGNDTADHWFNIGATGGLLAKLQGTVRVGYQIRTVTGSSHENFSHINASGSLSWPITRKLTLASQIARDFNTIATGASVDSTSISLQASYAFTRKIEFSAATTYGVSKFLGQNQPARSDDFFSFDLVAQYNMNEHFQVGSTYAYFRNWSTFSFSDFERHEISLNIACRY